MFESHHTVSVVTAILPNASAQSVVDDLVTNSGNVALIWKARGTLLHEAWWKRLAPPIGPTKTMLKMLVPTTGAESLVNGIVDGARLHQQATGAVFSTACDAAYLGSAFRALPVAPPDGAAGHDLRSKLSAIFCVVGPQLSDRIARAAINAGAHGPIVYNSEGRGLRDRLGWLRITKQRNKEVLLVLADDGDAEEIFDAMSKAGNLHLPGRGFMYRLGIDQGLFNLPSRISHHRYSADMQQIINALDHVTGHTHWRADTPRAVGQGRSAGVAVPEPANELKDQVCLSALVQRGQSQALIDLLLDAGAPGLSLSYARTVRGGRGAEAETAVGGARISEEYAMLRCITPQAIAAGICAQVEASAESIGVTDLGLFAVPVPRVATYVPGARDYRRNRAA